MAKLVVRQMGVRDIMRVRNVRQRRVDVFSPSGDDSRLQDLQRQISGGLPEWTGSTYGIVAQVDDELCGFALLERDDERYCWNVLTLAAGSERVDATDEVSVELWNAMLEYAVQQAGRHGMRRLTAVPPERTLAQDALERSGFAAYSRVYLLRGVLECSGVERPVLREQHESDIWSIHQIYNRTTPLAVQFAEARTSDWWRNDGGAAIPGTNARSMGFVLDSSNGIAFYCRIVSRHRPIVTFMVGPEFDSAVLPLVCEAVERAGFSGSELDVVIPAYHQEHVPVFLDAGLWLDSERVAMVRHTTVHRVVHPAFDRATVRAAHVPRARGVPTLIHSQIRQH